MKASSPQDAAGDDGRRDQLLDVYKLSVEMADRISARRATANSFFLTLHTGLAAFVGIVGSARRPVPGSASRAFDPFGLVFASVVGVVLSITWWLLLRSYRDLNQAKFKVIGELEAELPFQPFEREWTYLKEDPVKPWRQRYAELGFIERVVPFVFMLVYVVLALRTWLA